MGGSCVFHSSSIISSTAMSVHVCVFLFGYDVGEKIKRTHTQTDVYAQWYYFTRRAHTHTHPHHVELTPSSGRARIVQCVCLF